MNVFKQALGGISTGNELEVANRRGNFIITVAGSPKNCIGIIGVDTIEYTKSKGSIFIAENVSFLMIGAAQLGFEEESFVGCSVGAGTHFH